jgi:elongator complex protein 3
VYRDIPGHNVVDGCRLTNMRQVIQDRMRREGRRCSCIRCREIRGDAKPMTSLVANDLVYDTATSTEHFLSFDTEADQLAGYLRLSLPREPETGLGIGALTAAALVREVHVYGRAQVLGARDHDRTQHRGLGTRLMQRAESLARDAGHVRVAVIASVGTREWYSRLGYRLEDTYMIRDLPGEG